MRAALWIQSTTEGAIDASRLNDGEHDLDMQRTRDEQGKLAQR